MKINFRLTKVLLMSIVVGLLSSTVFTGCGKRIPVQKKPVISKIGNDNFSKTLKKEPQTSLVIGIVDPKTKVEGGKDSQELARALSTSISEIISAKGFKLKGPYQSFDDITYRDKKMIYLAVRPTLTLKIKDKQQVVRHSLYNQVKGVLTVSGDLVISFEEPMTGQIFIKRRINLSDLDISVPYVREYQTRLSSGGLTGAVMDSATAPDTLVNTYDYAMSQVNNEIYKKVITKIAKYIDREEIISFKSDILKLKGLKRF